MSNARDIETIGHDLDEIATRGESPPQEGRALALMEEWITSEGRIDALLERYAATSSAVIARTLAFLLARCASNRSLGTPSGPFILRAVARLGVDDQWARVNLLTAIQLSSMHDELLGEDRVPPQFLVDFLLQCAGDQEQVQSALSGAIAELHASGILARAPRPEYVHELKARLRAITPRPGSLLEMELAELGSFLDDRA